MYGDVACEWALVTAPVEEPISLGEAKLQSSIVQDDDNLLVAGYIQAAREAAQNFLNRALFTQTWKLQLSDFADEISLPMAAPLQNDPTANPSTAPVVQYYDTDGTLQTLATTYYEVDITSEPGRIVRKPNQTYPSVQSDRSRPVIVTYVCGWTTVDTIPEHIKQGMRYYIAAMDGDRIGEQAEAVIRAAQTCWTMAGVVYWRPPTCRYA